MWTKNMTYINIWYFYNTTGKINDGSVVVSYCPTTKEMISDYFIIKALLQGSLFRQHKNAIKVSLDSQTDKYDRYESEYKTAKEAAQSKLS